MTFCLYECLRAVGLQHHYARFASVGVHRAAHLSGLTMEDYPLLGIRSMEDRTRLFHLIQMVKTLDLESLEHEDDDDYSSDGGDEGILVADSSVTHDGCGNPGEYVYEDVDEKGAAASKLSADSFSKPSCVRRRLDFDAETIDHHQKPFPRPVGIAHVYASHNRNNEPGQDRGSTVPVQLQLDSGSAVVCSCKGRNNHMLDVQMHQFEHQTRAHTKPNDVEGILTYSSLTKSSPKCVSSPKLTHWPPAVGNKRFSSKPASEHTAKPTPVFESKKAADYNYGLPLRSPSASNKKQTGGPRISVCVRKRPLTRSECRRGETDVVTTSSPDCVIVHESKEAVDLTQYILQHRFYFDQVFGEDSSNEEVYQRTAYPLVQHMLNGGKATCFAYGQTGAGKTHTMLGSSSGRPGLYALAVRDIFSHLYAAHTQSHLLVYVSFFEIYCGQLYDLLDHRKRLFAREDGQQVVHIAGLRDVRVDSVSSLLEVISQGTEERTQGVSGVNPLSSRSHALLQIQLRHPNQQIAGRMWFVDLAGSERASDTKAPDKQSRMEGAEINQSLLALKECIRSLDQEQLHTPFRQSKLTQVLKDSFVGDSMTCMIANISPGHLATEHTLNTLRYADRVKELRGQGGGREGRRSKTSPSPKRNLFNSNNSSVGARGKSPPKKQKLGSRNEAFGTMTPTKKLSARGSIVCSTPKNSKWADETSSSARKEIEFEQITPIKGLLGGGDKRERGERGAVREGRGREKHEGSDSAGPSNVRAEPLSRQVTELHFRELQRESEFHHKEKKNQQSALKGAREGEERWVELRRPVESKGGRCSEVESPRERESQRSGERDKERESHLRRYHQQLQQFMPSSSSSSTRFYSPSTCLSTSSSNQASLTSSVSPSARPSVRHPSHLSASADMYHGLEDVLDAYGAQAEVRAGAHRGQLSLCPTEEISLQTETSPNYDENKDAAHHGYSAVTGEDLRVYWEGTEERFGQKTVKSDNMRAPSEGEVRGREGWRPADVEEGGRRWAWVATTGTEQADRVTGARPADVEAIMFYNCESEVGERGRDASDVPADRAWRAEEDGADGFGSASTHSHILFNHHLSETPHQRSPAERPLSPACEHTNTPNKLSHLSVNSEHDRGTSNTLPLPLQNAQQGVSTRGCREKEAWFSANANKRDPSDARPLTAAITRSGCKTCVKPLNISSENPAQTQVKAKMSVLPQEEKSTDSFSFIMDPLSVSLLQVDQQAASASFLQGGRKKPSLCPLENEKGKDRRQGNIVEDEDAESSSSLLEMLQAKIQSRPTPQTRPEVTGNKAPPSLLKPSTCTSMETSVTQSSSSSFKDSESTGSPSSLIKNGGTQMPQDYAQTEDSRLSLSILAPQSENVSGQLNTLPKQCHSVHSNHSNDSNIPLQPNRPSELDSQESINQQIRPIIHLSTLEGLDHGQLRVVQAHWEQLEEMETLWRKEGTLLCQQPDMVFGEYVHKLGEIMERKARCVHSMIAQLQPYLRTSHSNRPHNNREDNHDKTGHG